ncbi:hypothetical protein B0T09DRAFT_358563 [Sordaria sp. MPI-SDFR-AT-0083]|nr:hypothetical protein B0T09DRAFT_358563 [Sordaria sp. MPI-SDFR-AT-0083]
MSSASAPSMRSSGSGGFTWEEASRGGNVSVVLYMKGDEKAWRHAVRPSIDMYVIPPRLDTFASEILVGVSPRPGKTDSRIASGKPFHVSLDDFRLTDSQTVSAAESVAADGRGIAFRVAISSDVSSNSAYDAVVQVIVPNDVGWSALAWGGSMTKNPLMVFWRGSNNQPVISSRWANAHSTPQSYTGATYTLFKTGTKSNSTHWQFTALCTGCTSWSADGGAVRYVQPSGGNRLAFAYSPTKPSNPSSPTSAITVHDVHAYWNHDFNTARNTNFEAAVQKLLGNKKFKA